jgi:aminopeptidase N
LAALIVFAPIAATGQQTSRTAQPLRTRPLPPIQYVPARNYDTKHIALNLSFDWEREQAMGTATISFSPLTSNLKQLELDAANMTFASVTLSGGEALKFEADTPNEKLRITLDKIYQPSDLVTVVIAYHTNGIAEKARRAGGGLFFMKPTADEPNRPKQIWSQGESEWNHYWFPCFDHPNDFATSEMIATVQRPFTVLSNGKLIEKRDNPDGTQTFHWRMDEPHASYLASIVVGEFAMIEQNHNGIPIVSYVYADQVEEGKTTVAHVPEMMKLFESLTGIKYPNAKYGQAFVSGFGGGMENITATTMSDQTIHDARTQLDKNEDGLLSHELAHSWFGNYVTARTWADLWLNEGFATYFEGLWLEHHVGRDEFLYSEVRANQEGYFNAWRQNVRRPIVTKNYRDPDAVFDAYAYPRSGAVLHMLRKVLGDDDWWRSINHFLRKYPHQPVETEQFRIAIEETTGQPLEWFFDQWVYRMGHPMFRVTQDYDPALKALTLKVRQEQRIDEDNAYPQVRFFQTPVEIEIVVGDVSRIERVQIEAREEQSFTFAAETKPLLVNFDHGGMLIKELTFDKPTSELTYQLRSDKDVLGRLWALEQLSKRLKDNGTSPAERKAIEETLGSAVIGDQFWGIRKDAAAALNGSKTASQALIAGTKDADARVRSASVKSLTVCSECASLAFFQDLLKDKSYAVVREAALALGATKSPGAYEPLVKLLDAPSWRDNIRASGLSGLAILADSRALDLGLKYAGNSNPKDVRLAAYALLAAVGKTDARTFPIISEAFNNAVKSGSTSLTTATAEALLELGDKRGVEIFESARKSTTRPEFQFLISQYETQLKQRRNPSQ